MSWFCDLCGRPWTGGGICANCRESGRWAAFCDSHHKYVAEESEKRKQMKHLHLSKNDAFDLYGGVGWLQTYCGDYPILESFSVDPENANYSAVDGVLYNREQTVLIKYPQQKKDAEFKVPDTVRYIDRHAFDDCKYLERIVLPNEIDGMGIGMYAFNGCESLKTITIPDKVVEIQIGCFACCKGLKTVSLPDSVRRIDNEAFSKCQNLTSIQIPVSVKKIQSNAFLRCDSLKTAYYTGTKEQREAMEIEAPNHELLNAEWVYAASDHAHKTQT